MRWQQPLPSRAFCRRIYKEYRFQGLFSLGNTSMWGKNLGTWHGETGMGEEVPRMGEFQGKSVYKGIAIGRIKVYQKDKMQVKRVKIQEPEEEKKRFKVAVKKAQEQLQVLYEKALVEVGEANAAIFEIHQMMLEDDGYAESVYNIIDTQMVNAEYAVATTGDNLAQVFAAMDDE